MRGGQQGTLASPLVNIIHNLICCCSRMIGIDILSHPRYQMVLKCSFDQLMKQIWGDKFVNICTFEIICKWLKDMSIED